MPSNRDDFSQGTKDLLAKRVGCKCSNPACRKLTCGANVDPTAFTNIGVAAHICAAAEGGPRYDSAMSSDERKSYENGIWLCQSCSKLIDSDVSRYSVDKLNRWKSNAEEATILELEEASPVQSPVQDVELIKFYAQCLDRSAFRDQISQEGCMEDFDKAIENTIIAFNTGILRTRDGDILKQAEGKAAVQNPEWRDKLFTIVDILTAIRRRLKIAEKEQAFFQRDDSCGGFYYFRDHELEEWFDRSREEVLKIMSSICKEAGMHELHFPKRYYRW